MTTTHPAGGQLGRNIFVATLLGTCAFATVVVLVLRLMPDNSGDTAPNVVPTQQLTTER